MLPATKSGRCGRSATRERQAVAADGYAVDGQPAAVGGTQPGQHREQGRLATAGGTGDRGDAGPPQDQGGAVEGRHDPARVGDGDVVDHEVAVAAAAQRTLGHRARQELVDALEGRDALGRGVELGADPAQGPVGLRRQEQHDQGRAQTQVAAVEADADGDRDQGDREGGDQLEDGRAGEGDAQGLEAGPAVALGDLADAGGLGLRTPEGDQRGETAHHVEEVAGQRRQGAPLALGPVAGGQTDEGAEDRDQGKGGEDDHGARDVLRGDHHDGEQGQDRRRGPAPGGSG